MREGDVRSLYLDALERYGDHASAYRALRAELYAALQVEKPHPHSDHPKHLAAHVGKRALTHKEAADTLHTQRGAVANEHHADLAARRKASPDGDRYGGPWVSDAHHHVQREHGKALWADVAALIEAAGITELGVGGVPSP